MAVIVWAALSLLLAGCATGEETEEIVFETLSKDFYSMVEDQAFEVFRDPIAFESRLASAGIDLQDGIDFDTQTAIAVFMGQKPTGGYDIEVKRIVESGNRITVFYELLEPSQDDMVIQVITSPYHIVTIGHTEKEIVFESL